MTSITTQNKFKSVLLKFVKIVAVTAFWILIWEAVALFVSRDNELMLLILPKPLTVFKKWLEIAFTQEFIFAVLTTIARILKGFLLGIVLGFILGIFTHISKIFNAVFSPFLKILRAVPVVAIILILYVFFESTTLPFVIVTLMVLPLIWQSTHDGLLNVDIKLIEFAYVYKISKYKSIFIIKLPCILNSLITSTVNSLGLAWKSGIAAEVICTTNCSIGYLIAKGKSGISNDEVFAATITIIIVSIIIEYFIKFLCNKYLLNNGGGAND